jgi:SAM-dependent methyltransferase
MADWTSGYVSDIGYTFGYYQELNPLRLKLALLKKGIVIPEIKVACELGFGQGVSANFHAAASNIEWYGTDFNPAQASFAQELARESGAAAHLTDEAFEQFVNRPDLPDFDFIALHGIWSWISDHNRGVIVDFIKRKLKVGGVVYISYNTMPGWAQFAPMRHLMTEHAEIVGSQGTDIASRIDDAIEFAEQMLAVNPLFSRVNTGVKDRLSRMKEMSRHYLAHEYFNRDWHPMHFATLGHWLADGKVTFACSASYLDHIDGINLSPEQITFLSEISNPMFKESVRDFITNQQFRKDYWVKGLRKLSRIEILERLREQRLILTTHRTDIDLKVTGTLGEATMSEAVYGPILDLLADHTPRSVAQIEQSLQAHNIAFAQLAEAVMVLCGSGHAHPVQDEQVSNKVKKQTERVNTYICNKARDAADFAYLVSPVIGGGFAVSRFEQLFLLAHDSGLKQPKDWAGYAWRILQSQGQKLVMKGEVLDSDQDNIDELQRQADEMATKRFKIFKSLKIV